MKLTIGQASMLLMWALGFCTAVKFYLSGGIGGFMLCFILWLYVGSLKMLHRIWTHL